MEIFDRVLVKYGNRFVLACLVALGFYGPASTYVFAADPGDGVDVNAAAETAAEVASTAEFPNSPTATGGPVNMAAWANIDRMRDLARKNPDKILREFTRTLDDAQTTLAAAGVSRDLFGELELRLFDVESVDQEIRALRATLAAWEEIEHSDSAAEIIPLLKNRLAEMVMEPAAAEK